MRDEMAKGRNNDQRLDRRSVLLGSTTIAAAAAAIGAGPPIQVTQAQAQPAAPSGPPNIVYFLVDNLGYGEFGCYGGGILRGADTRRIDAFATEGMKLLNFAPEAQCTPSRSALMTGRYAIRSGNHTVALPGEEGGLVRWEKTIADILSARGYATACVGKWHIGESDGRWPTDHGFDEWYGPPRTWDESLWPDDPWYDPKRDGLTSMMESRHGESARAVKQLTLDVRRDVDVEFLARSKAFMKRSVEARKPFFLYFNHSLMHMPTIPRAEFKGKSGQGDWADCLLELDGDFAAILDSLKELGVDNNTIVVFSGDNGPEEIEPWRGTPGFFEGSYFTGMEGSLRTPCLVRYPGRVPAGELSNEIVHITDMFTTLLGWARGGHPEGSRNRRARSACLSGKQVEDFGARGLSVLDGRYTLRREVAQLQTGDVFAEATVGPRSEAPDPACRQSDGRSQGAQGLRFAVSAFMDGGALRKDFA
jgi:arylsulfatase A-like enzyme